MENNVNALLRKCIRNLEPYKCARNEFSGTASVWLDANENPYNAPYNRYPDPLQREVKEKLAEIKGTKAENIFLGVGSDECIDLCYRVFCEPRIDNVVAIAPTYGMYEVCASINDVEYRKVPLNDDFSIDTEALLKAADDNTKVMWICSPNNPTGNAFPQGKIVELCKKFKGIIVVDEAYIDFSDKGTMLGMLDEFPRLIVMQTFSKAWGSAAVRLGIAYASQEIIEIFNKVKYPYNVNLLTQNYALDLLKKASKVRDWVDVILQNRLIFAIDLQGMSCVRHIYPTDANFLLVKVDDANALYEYLKDTGVIVRNRNNVEKCLGCLRITIGTHDENSQLLNAIKQYDDARKQ